jgi:hypothetical protein
LADTPSIASVAQQPLRHDAEIKMASAWRATISLKANAEIRRRGP